MPFFEHQDRARRSTGRLVLLFALGYALTCGSIWLIVSGLVLAADEGRGNFAQIAFDPNVLLWSWGPISLIIGVTSLVKHGELSGGGAKVARLFGGVEVDPATGSPAERQLLNVVEEMSLASGCPVPRVFVIQDNAINAFAAGDSPDDAAIGVTSQAIESFERDELQGVIAHEFSHIFHGDMRMNKRITAAIAGIMALGIVGWIMMRYIGPAIARSGGGRKNNGAPIGLAIILGGLALMAIGAIGTFFGQVIQAAISRQREFLADASAVQYTRNPRGIANALRRIGGWRKTVVENTKVAACSHYFFCSAVDSVFNTHPPLEERIRRIEALPITAEIGDGGTAGQSMAQRTAPRPTSRATSLPHVPGTPGIPGVPPIPGMPRVPGMPIMGAAPLAMAVASVGTITADRIKWAQQALHSIPDQVRDAAKSPAGARALFVLLLGAGDAEIEAMRSIDPDASPIATKVAPLLRALSRRDRMVVADLAMPALRRTDPGDYRRYRKQLAGLVRADGRVTLAEWTLLNALRAHVEWPMFGSPDRSVPGSQRLIALRAPVVTYLGILAQAGSDPDGAAHALAAGLSVLHIGGGGLPPTDTLNLDALAKACEQLRSLDPRDRDSLLQAAAAVVSHDQRVADDEYDIVRVLADTLGAPLPPLVSPAAA